MSVHPGQPSRQRGYRRDYLRAQRDIKRASGICVEASCQRPSKGFWRCLPCRIKHAAASARRRRGGR